MNRKHSPDETTLNYIARLFDGEGYCGIYKNARAWSIIVGMEMVDRKGLDVLAEVWPARVLLRRGRNWPT